MVRLIDHFRCDSLRTIVLCNAEPLRDEKLPYDLFSYHPSTRGAAHVR
jgi:hypothetical protein